MIILYNEVPPGVNPAVVIKQKHTSSRSSREKGTGKLQNDNGHNRDIWGHRLERKDKHHVRICFVNINGIGMYKKSEKSEDIRQFMTKKKVDVMGLAETNVNWSRVRTSDTLWERTRTWHEHRIISISYNTKDTVGKSRKQQGGTATILKDNIAHRHTGSGFDELGLGRWSWVKIAGSREKVTRFVTVYCPVQTGRGNTVYNQQMRETLEDPTSRFWIDLGTQIIKWQADGEQLVICGDWNENVVSTNIKEWMALLHLKELVTDLHGENPPPTYQRGETAIDGIFASETLSAERAGYLGFGDIPGDHRGIWIDVKSSNLIGYRMNDIPRHKARRLKLDDPRVVDKYNRLLDQHLRSHNVYNRIDQLENKLKQEGRITPELKHQYDSLDKIREEGMKFAEKRCRKLRMGGVEWSPSIQKARNTILFWTLVRKRRKGCKVSVRKILRMKKSLKIKGEKEMSNTEIDTEIDKSYQKYKKLRKEAYDLRLTYQEALAQAKASKNDSDAIKVLREMQNRESTRRMFKQIGNTIKEAKTSTTKIHIRTRTGFKEITKALAMERYIMAENEDKFHQTEGWTPLLTGPLARDIGILGDGPRVKDILAGTYKAPEGSSDAVQRWLDTLVVKDTQDRRWVKATLTDYQEGWKKVKEKTSSGELHFGHFKAGTKLTNIGKVHYKLSMLPMTYGFSPQRWLQGTDVMILKAPNVYFLDKLRTIVLYEADFNHENRRLGKTAMDMAIRQDKIAPEQFSRPGRSAQDNALGKRLVFDHFRLVKRPLGMCSCDLKSCYDRVVHSAASLALQNIGVPKEALQCMFGTIQNLVHKVRTAYGMSKETFGGASDKYQCLPQGLGQGNGAGPTVWSILSSTVFESLRDQGYTTMFCSALSLGLMKLCGFSYVDDSDLLADGKTVEEVYKNLQSILDEWDVLMQVNGAAIAPDKCWWYLIDFEWKEGKWKYSSPMRDRMLQVRDKTGEKKSLKRLNHDDAMEMVGVLLAPDGNSKKQTDALRKKTVQWAQKITRSPLEPDTVWTAINRTIAKTVEYPLAATTLTDKELTHIMAPVLMAGLPRANILRTYPRDVLYGPTSLQGLGVTDPYIYQYCRHVHDIVTQPWRHTEIGELIKVNLEGVKLEAGIYGSIFDTDVEITWMNTKSSYIMETQKFCQEHGICFDEPGASLQPNCHHDESLMEAFSKQAFSTEQLQTLNRCRLYCRVISLSDVSDGWGKHLLTQSMSNPVRWDDLYQYQWPEQGRPPRTEWNFWIKALHSTFTRTGRALFHSLGQWNQSYVTASPRWKYHVHDNVLYQREETGWTQRTLKVHRSGRNRIFHLEGRPGNGPPPGAYRTRVVHTKLSIMTTGFREIETLEVERMNTATLNSILLNHPDAQWICQWISKPDDLQALVKDMYTGRAIGISDGSYKDSWKLCSAGWIIWTDQSELRGGGTIPGPEDASTSYRGELGGILGLVLMVHVLETLFPPPEHYDIRIGCDGLSALGRSLLTEREFFQPVKKDYDLVARIIDYKQQIKGDILPFHVKGHQKDKGQPLTLAAILNNRMDTLAKEINTHTKKRNWEVADALPPIPQGFAQVDYGEEPIVSDLCQTLVRRVSGQRLMTYWKKKGRLKEAHLETWIDWKVLSLVMKESSHRMKLFISKWVSNQVAVGEVMERRRERESGLCPCCGKVLETKLHVLRCRHNKQVWKQARKPLRRWMRRHDTDPEIMDAIIDILRNFQKRDDFDSYVPQGYSPDVQLCLNAQSHLGITNWLEGYLTYDWAAIQHNYYRSIGSRKTGRRWAVGLSTQLWKMVFYMWDYRNKVLHEKGQVEKLSGLDIVKRAITTELQRGMLTLDPIYYTYFTYTDAQIKKMKSVEARNWLVLIRRAREAKGFKYNDSIAKSIPLKKWIGLTTQKKAKQQYMTLARTGYNH